MKSAMLRLAAALVAIVSLGIAYQRADAPTIPRMSQAANAFLASLTPEQRAEATFAMDNQEERLFWQFIPAREILQRTGRPRKGLTFEEMKPEQRHLATALLAAGLSTQGFIKAESIMSLEEVLRQLEHDDGVRRNPLKYHFSIFGTPSERGVWGYRVEGHHISLNYTIVNDKVAASPSFFGSNPAEVREGPRAGLKILAREEALARDLVDALTPEQRAVAIVSDNAPREILTSNTRKAALKGQPSGIGAAKLSAGQRTLLTLADGSSHLGQVFIEKGHHLLGTHLLGDGGKTADVGKKNGNP